MQILASNAFLDALPQRAFNLTFSLTFKLDRGVIASEHIQGIAIGDYTVLRLLTHQVKFHAILLEIFDDECITLVEYQLEAVGAQEFAIFCLAQQQLVTVTLGRIP